MKTAFVLAGGGMKGAFQAGCIDSLLSRDIVPDFIYGISVGALNAALSCKLITETNRDKNPVSSWWVENVREPKDFFESKSIFFSIAPSILKKTFNGLYGSTSLAKKIQKTINRETLLAKDIKISVGSVNLSDGLIYYKTPEDINFNSYLLASSSIPGILPSVEINGGSYVDGGIRTVAPLRPAIDALADRIFVLLCNPESYPAKNYYPGDITKDIDRYFSIITDAMIVKDIDFTNYVNINLEDPNSFSSKLGKRKIEIHIIRPAGEINIDLTGFSPKDIIELINNGKTITNKYLDSKSC